MAQKSHYNKPRKHKFKYKVINWKQYNQSLKDRYDITFWISDEIIAMWKALNENVGRGKTQDYSDKAIETCLIFRSLFRLPLRGTEGFMNSLKRLMNLDISIPNFSTFSKRAKDLEMEKLIDSVAPGSYVILDVTGLKVYGKDEWHTEKHKVKAHRTFKKLHLAIDEEFNILASLLTDKDVADMNGVEGILEQINYIDTFVADGAYDKKDVYDSIRSKFGAVNIVIPPRKDAVIKETADKQRNKHIATINEKGRDSWEKQTNYGIRNLVEQQMLRYKTILGNKLKSREDSRQQTEVKIACEILNRMTSLGMPNSVKII